MNNKDFAFSIWNYIIIGVSILIIIIGFALMSGGGAPQDDITFKPEIFSTRRIVVAPVITMIGFSLMIVGILWNRKGNKSEE
ncbi:MAG: DUF3098 domain-containing protein [Dysgonamonadaceae bacterium]|jgi:hypothetical protein|nr:DUF3098 domain-containing protein [Dysgonamonadaceae bacterium]